MQAVKKILGGEGLMAKFKRMNRWGRWKAPGDYVGTDEVGNKYYQKIGGLAGMSRWVEYADPIPDPTTVPPEWHGWLHYSSDIPGSQLKQIFQPRYQLPHHPNYTGTDKAYHPHNYLPNAEFKPRSQTDHNPDPWRPHQRELIRQQEEENTNIKNLTNL